MERALGRFGEPSGGERQLEARLPALLKGELQLSDNGERLELAEICRAKRLDPTAAGLYADAFAADPKLVADPIDNTLCDAACCAALAAAGRGEQAFKLDNPALAKLRTQALVWLNNELASLTNLLDSDPPQARPLVMQGLDQWEQNSDLESIRDKAALDKLSMEEQNACLQRWSAVSALRGKASEKK